MPNKGPFEITKCWTNDTVVLHYDTIKIRYNKCLIIPYTSDTNIGVFFLMLRCHIQIYQLNTSVYTYIYLKLGTK